MNSPVPYELNDKWGKKYMKENKGTIIDKGLVHFQMKITPSFTHLQAILGVYDFLLSDEHNLRNINKYPDASELYNSSEWDQRVWDEESASIHIHSS